MTHYVGTLDLDGSTFTAHGSSTTSVWNELSQELGRQWDAALDAVLDKDGPKRAIDLIDVGDKFSKIDNVLLEHKWDTEGVVESDGATLTVVLESA